MLIHLRMVKTFHCHGTYSSMVRVIGMLIRWWLWWVWLSLGWWWWWLVVMVMMVMMMMMHWHLHFLKVLMESSIQGLHCTTTVRTLLCKGNLCIWLWSSYMIIMIIIYDDHEINIYDHHDYQHIWLSYHHHIWSSWEGRSSSSSLTQSPLTSS